jgi:hypothetical protein
VEEVGDTYFHCSEGDDYSSAYCEQVEEAVAVVVGSWKWPFPYLFKCKWFFHATDVATDTYSRAVELMFGQCCLLWLFVCVFEPPLCWPPFRGFISNT